MRYCREKFIKDIARLEKLQKPRQKIRTRMIKLLCENESIVSGYAFDDVLIKSSEKAIKEHRLTKYINVRR